MAPQNIVISLDGATFSILKNYVETEQLNPNTGLGLIAREGVFVPSTVVTPSLTAPSHIAIATGSSAARNDINANSFHLIKSPFNTNISGFGAPIGGYDALHLDGAHEDETLTAEPLWVKLREAGKKVVAATFPGADGATIRLPGVDPAPIIQSSDIRTVDYTVPFGAFGGLGAKGFSLDAADFTVAPEAAAQELARLGMASFSDVKVAELEDIPAQGRGSLTGGSSNAYDLQIAAIDTTDDRVVNYNQAVVFDANRGIEPMSNAPSTGSAFLNPYNQTIRPFFFEGSNNVVGTSFILTNLATDLSTVRLIRTSANYIPRPADNPAVIADVNDINNTIGFWRPQPDFRIAQRISPGLETFPDLELEGADEALIDTFVEYQTDVLLRGIQQNPDADLVLGYLEQPDGAQHQFLLTDPRQATDPSNPNSIGVGQDPAQVDRFQDYVLHAYQVASDAVQRVIDAVGVDEAGVPNSNIVITSDHGFAPFHTAVNMNNILANAEFDLNQVRAATSGPAVNIYINLKGREPNGTVEPSEYQALQQQVVSTLRGLQDENFIYASEEDIALFDKIYQRPIPSNPTAQDIINATSQFIGQDTGDVFALLSLGYNFDGFQPSVQRKGNEVPPGEQQPIFSVPSFYGAHGYDPNLTEMQASFLAIGPDFNANALSDLERVRSIDIAPTILDLLDVEPAPTVEGTSIFKQTGSNDFETALERLEDDVLGIVDDNPLLLSGVRDEIIDAFNFLGEIDPTAIKNILNLDSDRLLNVVDDWINLDQVINVINLATSLGQGSLLLGEEAINAISGISDLEASTAIEGMNARTSNFTLA
ncbi:alkaline phosphatase family protein [Trichocoleus sp. FACHB-591]|uniref:alkaline phosphatase family protein n=1 Tax=Trichocoleus sp. FACHB-591 TaxID=2692872 RepID=UPI0016853D72|nr:alkaline phosphatase family protein [Trichocoleus sp. FACHB-591]MBD2096113.1 alkaline phosphatase family protein [Trichocoleus sp. FACHB-591]